MMCQLVRSREFSLSIGLKTRLIPKILINISKKFLIS